MSTRRRKSVQAEPSQPRYYFGKDVPMRVIRQYARQIAQRFEPDKIILFGSRAWGTPHADSDVDLLVVMPAKNELDRAFKIRLALPAPFPLDLIVRTPSELAWRLAEKESFSTEIVTKGKVLYENEHAAVGSQGRSRPTGRGTSRGGKRATA